jgi:hypothetical protein
MVSIELPRFVEPPFRLDLTVMHEPITPDRARHLVELQTGPAEVHRVELTACIDRTVTTTAI